jgi:pimeloyl-ACP methyl ester carboxylesterase
MDVSPSPPTTPPPLVGRDRELALLHDRLAATQGGRGSLVLIGGEAGIGKTALADVLCRQATEMSAAVLAVHCYDRTETSPYGPWIEIARRVETIPGLSDAPPLPRLDDATSQAALFAQWTYGEDPTQAPTRDEVLDNLSLYWLTNTATSAARFYWENRDQNLISAAAQKTDQITLPVAITVFPDDDLFRAPETWARRAFPSLIYFHQADRGGHFAAWEEPHLFSFEVRAAFRSLR